MAEDLEQIDELDETTPDCEHEIITDIAVAPTCTTTGLTEGKHCSICGEVLEAQEIIDELGHNYKGDITAPTCTEKGYTTYTCSRCGDTYVSDYVDAIGHTWDAGKITTSPTCTSTGVRTYTCTICKTATKTETVAALGHDKIQHSAKAATCTEKGWNAYETCSRCDYTTYSEIPAKGHTKVVDKAVAATCTTTGLTEGAHCSVCKEVLTAQKVIPKLDHDWIDATYDAPKTCQICGATEGGELLTPLEEGLELYKAWAELRHFFTDLTEEQWNNFQTGENLSKEDMELVEDWVLNYNDPASLINQAHNYAYRLVEKGKVAELPKDIQQLVHRWNSDK